MDASALLSGALYLAIAIVLLQAGDAVAAVRDVRLVRDDDEPDALTRTRFREVVRSVALTAMIAVLAAAGVQVAIGRDGPDPVGGALALLATALAAFLVGLAGVLVVLRRERPTYARLRRDLRDRATGSLDPEELAAFEERLARADRVRARRPWAALVLRLAGCLVVAGIGIVLAAVGFGAGSPAAGIGALAGVVVELLAAAMAIRAGAVRAERVSSVLDGQRAEVAAILERARIPGRGSVPGLRDRVARALAILREKQR